MKKLFFILLLTSFLTPACDFKPQSNTAPDFALPSLNESSKITLSEINQQHSVLLVFWASWCPNCVEEIPTLNEWHRSFSAKGLKIVGINVQETRKQIEDFKSKYPIDYPIVMDEKGEVAERFGVYGLPSALVLAKGGEIVYYGFSLPSNLEQILT